MRKFILIGSFLLLLQNSSEAKPWSRPKENGQIGVVSVPVADVRKSSGALPQSHDYDPEQETQILYGEIIHIVSESGDWLQIEAVEQEEFSHNQKWQGYPGWVKKTCVMPIKVPERNFVVQRKTTTLYNNSSIEKPIMELSLGTQIYATDTLKKGFRKVRLVIGSSAWGPSADVRSIKHVPEEDWARSKIVEAASELLDDPYFWGGRAAHMPELKPQVTAVDCSGLTNLAYRVAGVRIPRDSLEQYMKAKKIKKDALKMGDLIFVASKEKPNKISHVAIFIDSQTLIEAPKSAETVHKITFEQKFGVTLDQIIDGEPTGERMIYFGTYF